MSALPFGQVFSYKKKALPCLLFDVDMHILIDKALKHFYMLQESLNIMLIYYCP